MVVRHRFHTVVALGRFNEGLRWAKELDELSRRKGLAATRFWTLGTGEVNHLISESEYPDFATFEKESEAFQSDAELMAVFRRGTDFVAEGEWPWDEIEIEASQLA